MKLASHNSWTFKKPVQWYLKPIWFMAKCQSMNIKEQYKYGVTYFDLRIKFHDDIPHIHHGIFDFGPVDLYDLSFLSSKKCYLRLMLESNSEMKDQDKQESLFREFCNRLETKYTGLKLIAGCRKYDGKTIYNFKNTDNPELFDRYSSVTSLFKSDNKFLKVVDDLWPWLYAKLKNKKNYEEAQTKSDDVYFFYDFVDMH